MAPLALLGRNQQGVAELTRAELFEHPPIAARGLTAIRSRAGPAPE
jgi:hypothetical protein